MLTQSTTIDAAIISAVALVIGSVLTIAGGFFATYFSQRITIKAEKRKVIRQKIEEIYILSNRLEEYSTKRAIDQVTLTPAKYTEKYARSYLLEEDSTVERMKMITSLYIPKLEKNVDEYKQEINRANRRIEQELDPKGRSLAALEKDKTYADTAISVHNDIANVHKNLRTALSEVISKY